MPDVDATRTTSQADVALETDHSHEVPVAALGTNSVPYEVLKYIPQESAEHYQIVPLGVNDGVLEVGMIDPENLAAVDAVNFISRKTGIPFKLFRVTEEDFEKVRAMYKGLGGDVDQALGDLQTEEQEEAENPASAVFDDRLDTLDLGKSGETPGPATSIREDAPAIKLASTILRYAIDGGASDIHIEQTESGVKVRYRVDGTLHTSVVLPADIHRALLARIKVLASMRLDEKRRPQDGRFSASIEGRRVDFRVSTFPAYNGEKVVLRILDREKGFIRLEDLGYTQRGIEAIRRAIKHPYGLILVSGPTGSGKSTTLYSMLSEVDRETQNVLSLEDPIEYYMDGVAQSQVRPEIGYTFANGLRTTLRQDPDVILVGEIRDGETAKLAIQAALTGHLVFSTIHTNSAVGTITRLIDMGVEPYLIPPVLVLSMAQRLVPKICPDAGTQAPITESMRELLEDQFSTLPQKFRPKIPEHVYEAGRTASCPMGTRGRLAVFEMLEMSPELERVILESPVESKLWEVARKQGMFTMKEDGLLKCFEGKVPFAEVNLLSGLHKSGDAVEEQPVVEDVQEVPPQETSTAEHGVQL